MSKGHDQQTDTDAVGKMADHVDVDAEHRPDTARRASNAGLVREAAKTKDAPTQAYADQSVIHSVQSHVKLSAARMRAGAANIRDALSKPANGPAGDDPMMQIIQSEIAGVVDDLDNLQLEIMHASKVVGGTLSPELGALYGAFHETWAPALNAVWSRTHDQDGNLRPNYQGYSLGVTSTQDKLQSVYQAAGVNPADLKATLGKRIADPAQAVEQRDEELQEAEMEALKASIYSVEVGMDLVKSDLRAASVDTSKASDLTRSVEQLVHVIEPINASHIGKIAKLPVMLKQLQALQGEVDGMAEGKDLAARIGTHSQMSFNISRIWNKLAAVNTAHKAAAKHH